MTHVYLYMLHQKKTLAIFAFAQHLGKFLC
jgi:hypothetical protein